MGEHGFSRRRVKRLLTLGVAAASLGGGSLMASTPAQAVTTNYGYACGYWAHQILWGVDQGTMGCPKQTSGSASTNSLSPAVTLPANGAATSQTDNDGAKAVFGPATLFSSPYDSLDNVTNSGQLSVSTSGTTVVSSSAKAVAVGPSPFWTKTPTSWQTAPDKGYVQSSCSASSPTSTSSSVSIHNGVVDTSTDANGYPVTQYTVPESPTANLQVNFTIDNVGDSGHMIFYETSTGADGTFTVNGSNMYMDGPNSVGNVIIAQSKCRHS